VARDEAYVYTKWHLEPRSRLATIDMDRNWGCPVLGEGELAGSPSNTMSLASRPTFLPSGILMHPAIGHKRYGPRIGEGLCPFRGGGSPSKTNVTRAVAYLYPKFHLDPSNRMATIHQRYRQDRQTDRTDSPIA